jgi:hypothetical protein
LHPDLDIDEAIANVNTIGQPNPPPAPFDPSESHPKSGDTTDHDQPAHEFEWHETSPPDTESPGGEVRIQDGMALLSTLDAGYLGE